MSTPETPKDDKAKEAPVKTDVDLMKEVEMLRARLTVREDQLKQAVEIANRANEQNKAKDSAQKEMLVSSIQMDSHFTKEELAEKSLMELQTIRLTLDRNMDKTFASVAADAAEANRRKQSRFTGGWWDSKAGEWRT